jgi:hypothetical protein
MGMRFEMQWAQNVACIGEMRNAYTILVGKIGVRDYFAAVDVHRGKVLKFISEKYCWRL